MVGCLTNIDMPLVVHSLSLSPHLFILFLPYETRECLYDKSSAQIKHIKLNTNKKWKYSIKVPFLATSLRYTSDITPFVHI